MNPESYIPNINLYEQKLKKQELFFHYLNFSSNRGKSLKINYTLRLRGIYIGKLLTINFSLT